MDKNKNKTSTSRENERFDGTGEGASISGSTLDTAAKSRSAPSDTNKTLRKEIVSWIDPKIPRLPRKYDRLDPTSTVIRFGEYPYQGLLNRLVSGFEAFGLYASYFNNPASVVLYDTTHQTELHVALWRKQRDKICVHVSPVQGHPIIYDKYSSAILQAAQPVQSESEWKERMDAIVQSFMKDNDDKMVCAIQEVLETVGSIVSSNTTAESLDAKIMGFKTLCELTDPIKTNLHASVQVCTAVIFGSDSNNPSDVFNRIHQVVLEQAFKEGEPFDFSQESPSTLALTVVINALQVVANCGIQQPDLYEGNRVDKARLLVNNDWRNLARSNVWLQPLLDYIELFGILQGLEQDQTHLYDEVADSAFDQLQAYNKARPISPTFMAKFDCGSMHRRLDEKRRRSREELERDIGALENLRGGVKQGQVFYILSLLRDNLLHLLSNFTDN